MSYAYPGQALRGVGRTAVEERAQFIMRTYGHLVGAIVAFTALEVFFFTSGLAVPMAQAMLGGSWMIVLGAFMVAGWVASNFAQKAESKPAQYFGLGLYVVAEAVILVPMLFIAQMKAPGVIESAATVTLLGFAGMTGGVFVTRKDFSFLRGFLLFAGLMSLVAIGASLIFGFALGTFFSVAMVGLAGASILYNTSEILHRYPSHMYVSAALSLFASVALMFWYVLRLFMSRD